MNEFLDIHISKQILKLNNALRFICRTGQYRNDPYGNGPITVGVNLITGLIQNNWMIVTVIIHMIWLILTLQ